MKPFYLTAKEFAQRGREDFPPIVMIARDNQRTLPLPWILLAIAVYRCQQPSIQSLPLQKFSHDDHRLRSHQSPTVIWTSLARPLSLIAPVMISPMIWPQSIPFPVCRCGLRAGVRRCG